MVALVVAFERLAFDGLVFAKIVQSDQPSVFLHFTCQDARGFPFVEILSAMTRNTFERASQFRLQKVFIPVVESAAFQENPVRFWKLREGISARLKRAHLRIGNGKAGESQMDRRLQHFRPRFGAVLLQSKFETANASGHACSAPAEHTVLRGVAAGIEIHIVCGFAGSLFAKVYERRASIGHADEHEAAASEVSGIRKSYGERKADGDRGINRVPARFQNRDSHIRSQWFLRDDHSFARVNRLMPIARHWNESDGQEKREGRERTIFFHNRRL